MTDTTTTEPEPEPEAKVKRKTEYTVQQERILYERVEDDDGGEPSYTKIKAFVDISTAEAATKRQAISDVKKNREISAGRFRALAGTAAEVLEPRTETKIVERW